MKRVQFYLLEAKQSDKKYMPSYAIECLAYNIPDTTLNGSEYYDTIRDILAQIYQRVTQVPEPEPRWKEVNDIKFLLYDGQPWNRESIKDFAAAAWNEIGYS